MCPDNRSFWIDCHGAEAPPSNRVENAPAAIFRIGSYVDAPFGHAFMARFVALSTLAKLSEGRLWVCQNSGLWVPESAGAVLPSNADAGLPSTMRPVPFVIYFLWRLWRLFTVSLKLRGVSVYSDVRWIFSPEKEMAAYVSGIAVCDH